MGSGSRERSGSRGRGRAWADHFFRTGVHNPMEIVTRPERTLTIQLREFERPAKGGKRGGRMKLKASKTITLHDVTMDEIHSRILHALKGETR
jgi:hypothetical protein